MSSSKLKIAGTWAGTLDIELETWTVPMLREEIAKRSNLGPESINLISSGRVLRDGDGTQKLGDLGLKNNGKVLASKVSVDEGKRIEEEGKMEMMRVREEEERGKRLGRLKAAATALVNRHSDGSVPLEDYNIELEDQTGQKVNMGSETDQRAIMMGLMLHNKGKALIENQAYKDALDVLVMAEEAFSLCDPRLIDRVDNVSILQIDMVWCYFMLRDISLLSAAGVRLTKARDGIQRAHGKDASRVRILQEGSSPEVALYLRLELLEGVVAYYSAQAEMSRRLLTSAQAKLSKLQVSDEALSLLVSMGYMDYEVKRALRMNGQDVDSALTFLERETERQAKKHQEDLQRQKEIMEQKLYGTTPLGKAVDIQRLNELASMGFEREIAAEALRREENDFQKALDDLTNFDVHSVIMVHVETRKRKREERVRARYAPPARVETTEPLVQSDAASGSLLESTSHGAEPLLEDATASGGTLESTSPGAEPLLENATASGSSLPSVSHGEEDGSSLASATRGVDNCPSLASTSHRVDDRDLEMERQLANDLEGDAISDYDIDVSIEAEAIAEYLSLLDSSSGIEQQSTSQ